MKHMMLAGSLLIGALGMASAEDSSSFCDVSTPGCSVGSGKVMIVKPAATNKPAELVEKITVSIPAVVAMHLHETSWTVDLNDITKCDCYRAGEHNSTTGIDDVYKIADVMSSSKSTWFGDQQRANNNAYSVDGKMNLDPSNAKWINTPAKAYPGIEYTAAGAVSWKGPIVCFNRKIVEKFANTKAWNVTVSVNQGVTDGFPTLVLGDRLPSGFKKVETLYSNGTSKQLTFSNNDKDLDGRSTGYANSTTKGWLDDYILEALVFDGSETYGSKTAEVNFKLTGTF